MRILEEWSEMEAPSTRTWEGGSLGARQKCGRLHLSSCISVIKGNLCIPSMDPNLPFHPKVHQIIKSLSGLLSIMQINLLFKSEWNISSLS